MSSITLVSEDILSELLLERILQQMNPELDITQRLGLKGANYVQQKLKALNNAAAGMKILVLLDRDKASNCPIELIARWLGGSRNSNLVIRFAEMESESWLMADQEHLARYLDLPSNRIPSLPDRVEDPKRLLVSLARASRSRRVRDDMCPVKGSSAVVGPAYNQMLSKFIIEQWRLSRAMRNSPSLERAERRIRELILR